MPEEWIPPLQNSNSSLHSPTNKSQLTTMVVEIGVEEASLSKLTMMVLFFRSCTNHMYQDKDKERLTMTIKRKNLN